MPKLWEYGPYLFFCYVYDLLHEPPHFHVRSAGSEAKFWLQPQRIVWNRGHKASELARIEELIRDNQALLLERWYEERRLRQ